MSTKSWIIVSIVFFMLLLLTWVLITHFVIEPEINCKRQIILRNMMVDVSDTLQKHDVEYWADFGTLLGVYRDQDVIMGDRDVDLAIPRSEEDKAWQAIQELKAQGYSITRDAVKLKVWKSTNGVWFGCDICIYDEDKDNDQCFVRHTFMMEKSWIYPLKKLMYRGHHINVPGNTEKYLEYEYGETWRVPRKEDKGREGNDKGEHYNQYKSYVFGWGGAWKDIPLLYQKIERKA